MFLQHNTKPDKKRDVPVMHINISTRRSIAMFLSGFEPKTFWVSGICSSAAIRPRRGGAAGGIGAAAAEAGGVG